MKKLLLCLTVIAFLSCQKELSDDTLNPFVNVPEDSCRISRSYFYGGGGVSDSADYIYSGNKLTKVEGVHSDVFYTYSGDKLIAMHYYEKPANLLYHVDSFHYVNDTTISRVIAHDFDMFNHDDTVHSELDFVYSGNQLSQLITVASYEGFSDKDTSISEFRWENNNVRSILTKNTSWADDSIYYDYDNNPNYFTATSKYFFMVDPFFQLHVGFDPHLPYFISRNNVVNFRIYTNVDYPVQYQVDSLRHPTLVSQGGFDYMGYKWECP
jgi:hypothetical protein